MKEKRVLLIGRHPIADHIATQYQACGADVMWISFPETREPLRDIHGRTVGEVDVLCVFSESEGADALESDNRSMALLQWLATEDESATGVRLNHKDSRRVVCHLLLQNQTTLWALQNLDLPEAVNRCMDVYAFTMEDQWAKFAFANIGNQQSPCPPLDREAITEHSPKHVHLVLLGWNRATESLALHATLLGHYPNYVHNHQLRTRITLIDEAMDERGEAFRQRYHHLFENSYYRTIDLAAEQPSTQFHAPRYNGRRDEFVDVEWEFVRAAAYHPTLRQKLSLWAEDRTQVLTIVLCQAADSQNVDMAFNLPDAIYDHQIPVLPYVAQRGVLELISQNSRYGNIYPIGMEDCGYDVHLPLMDLARRLNYFYNCQFGQGVLPTDLPEKDVEREWSAVSSYSMRFSNLYNAMTMATKMRSLGHDEQDWGRFYAVTQAETELLSAVEHNRWSVERLILGFRPPTDSEREEIRENIQAICEARKNGTEVPKDLKKEYKRQRIHYDLCSYEELDIDSSGQDVRVYDYALTACIPLIMNSFDEANQPS